MTRKFKREREEISFSKARHLERQKGKAKGLKALVQPIYINRFRFSFFQQSYFQSNTFIKTFFWLSKLQSGLDWIGSFGQMIRRFKAGDSQNISFRLERVLGEIKTLITVSGEIESSALEIETVGRFSCLDFLSFQPFCSPDSHTFLLTELASPLKTSL